MKSNQTTILIPAIVSAVVSLSLIYGIGGGVRPGGSQVGSGQNVYSQVESSGTIRAAYNVGAPLFTIDPNTGQKSGICSTCNCTLSPRGWRACAL